MHYGHADLTPRTEKQPCGMWMIEREALVLAYVALALSTLQRERKFLAEIAESYVNVLPTSLTYVRIE